MKHYYTDPLAALWMMKHFGMKIVCGLPNHPMTYTDFKELIARDIEVITGNYGLSQDISYEPSDKFSVHPDSIGLLEPMEQDLVQYEDGKAMFIRNGWVIEIYDNQVNVAWQPDGILSEFLVPTQDIKIIQRNGISFMWPICEK